MAKRRTESKVEVTVGPVEVGGEEVLPGTIRRMELPVARLPTGTWLSLPLAVVHGVRPGPTIWLSAAIHGDELVGVAVIRSLLRRLDPTQMGGTIIAVPVVNVFGLINESRYLPDRRDLNRSFPGSKRGSLAAQLAHLFLEQVVSKCELGIDYHTGSNGRTNLPHLRCNLDDEQTQRLAAEFGPPVIMHAETRDGSLRAAAQTAGIRALLYEAGEALRLDRNGVKLGVEGTFRILRALSMIDRSGYPHPAQPIYARSSSWIRARRSGFCQVHVGLGDPVGAGHVLATISDLLGSEENEVKATEEGVVLGLSTKPLVNRGDALVHIARPIDL